MMKNFQPSGRATCNKMEKSEGSIFVYWLTKEGKNWERKKNNTKCILFYDNIFYLWPFSVVIILSYRKFYFLPSSVLLLNWVVFRKQKKTEWINENKNKQQRQLRERWVVVIFLVKCSRVWGAKNGNIKRHNKTREKCFKHIRLVFIAWIC